MENNTVLAKKNAPKVMVWERVNPYSGGQEFAKIGYRVLQDQNVLVAGSHRAVTFIREIGWVLTETLQGDE